ncbi:Protein CBR-GLB-3 [Caenorhabditis briggsae]|uniref:Protein CBR-GLB-3 n=1 Tax=Caenorhabditis briggsae TaxID=6238 RepID=A8Y4N8_CAEBR|nr:Protein CBR-GLB-3 [Caenorhabditis briggsae]CAP39858.2 Protein CBR-GLB-3 [Caenorhabditis briggsae]
MGNDHSAVANVDVRARRSLDSGMVNKAKHSCSTPRPSVQLPPPSPNQHRLSTDYSNSSSPRRSFSEQMGNNVPSRRMSRATVHLENSNGIENMSFIDAIHLSPHQVQLLTSTWPRIKTQSHLFTQVFKVLMQRSPVCREMFQKMSIVGGFSSNSVCDLNSHAKLLSELLDSLMTDLQQPAKIVLAKCQDVGAAHVNMNEKCFDQKVECVRSKREAVKSWMCVISYMADSIKSGYMEEWAKKKRSNNHPPPQNYQAAGGSCPYA